jgi:hypothetical protein
VNRFLEIAGAVGRLLLVFGGAFLVVTGLSSISKMFAGIGLIVLGSLCHVVLTTLIRRREPESRAALLPGGRPDANFLARSFATFWRASFLDAFLVLGAFLLVAQAYQDRYWFLRGGRLLGSPKGLQLLAWPAYLHTTLICVAFLVYFRGERLRQRTVGLLRGDARVVQEDRDHTGVRAVLDPDGGAPPCTTDRARLQPATGSAGGFLAPCWTRAWRAPSIGCGGSP